MKRVLAWLGFGSSVNDTMINAGIGAGANIDTPRIIPRAEHSISRAHISDAALKVLYRLHNAGYEAYVVGGGVRDMLLGREPKDFDVATNARPEQVQQLFRNCRLIGRRFRLAHVMFGREVIEVATFRAQASDDVEGDREVEEDGRILRDNVYGTLEQDAWRRDFTINALYYNIADFSVVDYTGGLDDLKAGVLRVIGDAAARYREDPVRMLRAARFAAKIGFRLHPSAEAPIAELAPLLDNIPPARLFEEVLKLFLGGCAVQTFELLRHYGLFGRLFPQTEESLAVEPDGFPLVMLARALANTDQRIQEDRPVTPAFLFAALLWEPVRLEAERLQRDEGMQEIPALLAAADHVVNRQCERIALPRRFRTPMEEIWVMQARLPRRGGRQAYKLMEHPRFRAAYDFLLLRASSGEVEAALAEWWTQFIAADEAGRERLLREASGSMPAAKPRRRRRRGGGVQRQKPPVPGQE